MARLVEKLPTDLICPFMTSDVNDPVRCQGEDCGCWSAVSDPRVVARGRMIVGCALVVANKLWRVSNW